ncbi:alpha/beta-hydrolase [Daldinia bambusicola]|nr:alpha/beta-hydrolase [Daldinia bambusicola]
MLLVVLPCHREIFETSIKMSVKNLPEIILVPGAFGTPACFDKLLPFLREAGFATHPGPYPSYNHANPAEATCVDDITHLRNNVILPLIEDQQKDVVIIAHSYGCVPSSAAAKDLGKQAREAQGKKGSVVGLILIAGIITLDGETAVEAMGEMPPYVRIDGDTAFVKEAMDYLYHDCDPDMAFELDKHLGGHAAAALATKATAPAWADSGFDGRRVYIRTLNDRCKSLEDQNKWLKRTNVEWNVIDFETGHYPFHSQPKAVAARLVEAINDFVSL